MLAEERRRRLLEELRRRGSLPVADAERKLRVSRMTIHRDLEVLSAQGLLRKVHGGAVVVGSDPHALPFERRVLAARPAKQAIARHLRKLVKGARSLVIDASSTAFLFVEHLLEEEAVDDLLIVTGNLALASEIVRRGKGIRVALHGGEPHPWTGALVGPLAAASLRDMRFDWAIVSCLGVMKDEGTVYVSNPEEVETKRLYLERARKSVLAVDTSKIGVSGAYALAALDELDALVTERGVVLNRNPRHERPARG